MSSEFASLWYFHLPNFILAALMYTLLGRALLGLMVQPESTNYIWRAFCRLTDPVVAIVAFVTPKAAAKGSMSTARPFAGSTACPRTKAPACCAR